PLVIGLGEDGNYCASDVAALLHLTNRFIFMEDGEIALLAPSKVMIWRLKGDRLEKVHKEAEEVEWTPQLLDKGMFDHFMLKEIHEQPHILRKIAESIDYYTRFSERLSSLLRDGSLTIVAAGTSYHAGMIGKYLLSKLAGVRSEIIVASEFPEWSSHLRQGDVVLAISQSGETADVLEAVRIAKSKGSMVVSIVNVPGSTLTRISDESVFIQAGPEVGVAATKTFSAQVAVLYVVSSLISGRSGISRELIEVSELLKGSMGSLEEFSKKMSDLLKDKEHVFFLGRGINYPTALEGALKLKEISYIHAEGYPAGEYKHGPLALIEEDTPAIVLVPVNEGLRKKTIYNIMEVRSRGAYTITIQPRGTEIPADASLETDVWNELISPLIYTVPLQLIAYHTAVILGRDPDKPRNLAKSVTVE
ncbi:MAG: glutamine--fructose-6-phosphate transaminase (isomerizing), partial [Candidatus Korarchaeota archaeon]|nr:glutamine--fructose-6-phosphate transaminase (isomerizing) [Candidatus Korarchaeota archaeon]